MLPPLGDRVIYLKGVRVSFPELIMAFSLAYHNEHVLYPNGEQLEPLECGEYPALGISIRRGHKEPAKPSPYHDGGDKLKNAAYEVMSARTMKEREEALLKVCREHKLTPPPDLTFREDT